MYFELRLPQYTWLPSDKRPLVYEAQSCCQVMGLSGSWWWHSGTGVAIGTKGTVAKRCHQQVRVVVQAKAASSSTQPLQHSQHHEISLGPQPGVWCMCPHVERLRQERSSPEPSQALPEGAPAM
ncbi:hypothetical protein KOW79_015806 [Hemibagrus wyckioides]|uniref:Uncharacterized protein n=1 Tax=Hemibagrus wyckioides TaxID=337641 RepID=A0A9D3NET4_9TELE|nr:hypothetical protein KOW79_015806 [Hemibagrus wyckioides]